MAPDVSSGDALLLRGISKSFPGVQALDDVSIGVQRGTVHALLGENGAGKSTLMNVLYGFTDPDKGEIFLHGKPITIRRPRDAVEAGIGMVHQHFMLVSDMTVTENVALRSASIRSPRPRLAAVTERIQRLSAEYGLAIEPNARIDQLSVGQQQRVELVKVLTEDPDIIVLDEPTAVLTAGEWAQLRQTLRQLADDGRTIIFITHKLDEVIGLADRATVLRSGRVIGNIERAEFNRDELARMMVGRDVNLAGEATAKAPAEVRLAVRSVVARNGDSARGVESVSLEVRSGEIVAIAGVDGNGQSQLVDAIVGLLPSIGEIEIVGATATSVTCDWFRAQGGAYIPADRGHAALALSLSVFDNAMMNGSLRREHSQRGWLRLKSAHQHIAALAEQFDVRMAGLDTRMGLLSGGNQQKVVLARELHHTPKVLIAAQPTRGLDVGACEYVYQRLRGYRDGGGAVLLVSTEIDEVKNVSDRVYVMVDGTISQSYDTADVTASQLGLLMGGASFGTRDDAA